MAGPVPTYLATQLAAQSAFSVPFGLLALVNTAISDATTAGMFNTTVDCSLFTAEDVSNLRIYLDSQGYLVEFAKNSGNKSLLIDWGKFLDIPGSVTAVTQGTVPWVVAGTVAATQSGPWTVSLTSGSIEIGTVDQGTGGSSPWLIREDEAANAVVTAVTVGTSSTLLLPANASRKGLSIQCKDAPVYIILGATATTSLYSWYVLKLNVLDRDDYTGPVAAVVDSGTATVLVTELV